MNLIAFITTVICVGSLQGQENDAKSINHFITKRANNSLRFTTSMGEINPKWNATSTDKLKRDLLLNYDKFARPAHHDNVTEVDLDLQLTRLDLDESRSILTLHGWTVFKWRDEKLKWNESDYDGIEIIRLANHEIWQPDIYTFNSASGSSIDHYANCNFIVDKEGDVIWAPPSTFQVFCELDFRKWPFDTQTCTVRLGSWTYNGDQIDLVDSSKGDIRPVFSYQNAEWIVKKIDKKRREMTYECCSNPYIDLIYQITLQRRSETYKILIFTPLTLIVFTILCTFWLPYNSYFKLASGAFTAIIICMFLLYFAQKVPSISGASPLIVTFYCLSLYLVAFSIVISVTVINLSQTSSMWPLPWFIKNSLGGWLGQWLFFEDSILRALCTERTLLENAKDRATDQQLCSDKDGRFKSQCALRNDWVLLAEALDRISFLIYSFLFSVFAIAYFP